MIETLEQSIARQNILTSTVTEISYVAPTSFGKSSIIIEHISTYLPQYEKIAVIVPTKSLLSQTYRLIRNADFKRKILIHDEMYIDEKEFIAVFTQERALRLLDKTDLAFDILESYAEIPYSQSTGYEKPVYIDLATKSRQELVNIAIIKIKIEEDFIGYKLSMLFQCLLDYEVITTDTYNLLIYGTTNQQKLHLVKMGLTINVVNKLEKDDQLKNIQIDANNNLRHNKNFIAYKKTVDDFFRFELNKFL